MSLTLVIRGGHLDKYFYVLVNICFNVMVDHEIKYCWSDLKQTEIPSGIITQNQETRSCYASRGGRQMMTMMMADDDEARISV